MRGAYRAADHHGADQVAVDDGVHIRDWNAQRVIRLRLAAPVGADIAARAVDQNRDRPQRRDSVAHHLGDLGFVGDVAGDGDCLDAPLANGLGHGSQVLGLVESRRCLHCDVMDRHGRAQVGQSLRDGPAQPRPDPVTNATCPANVFSIANLSL